MSQTTISADAVQPGQYVSIYENRLLYVENVSCMLSTGYLVVKGSYVGPVAHPNVTYKLNSDFPVVVHNNG